MNVKLLDSCIPQCSCPRYVVIQAQETMPSFEHDYILASIEIEWYLLDEVVAKKTQPGCIELEQMRGMH